MLERVLVFTKGEPLLVVSLLVTWAHVFHDGDLGRDLTFGGPSFGQKRADIGPVLVRVEISLKLLAVDEVLSRVMEVMIVAKVLSFGVNEHDG